MRIKIYKVQFHALIVIELWFFLLFSFETKFLWWKNTQVFSLFAVARKLTEIMNTRSKSWRRKYSTLMPLYCCKMKIKFNSQKNVCNIHNEVKSESHVDYEGNVKLKIKLPHYHDMAKVSSTPWIMHLERGVSFVASTSWFQPPPPLIFQHGS